MPFTIDTSTEHGAKVALQLLERKLGWLTTVSSGGTPQPNPVWFIWDDGSFVIFSKPGQAKLANIARHPQVSFNLEATEDEEQITIFTGTAEVIDRATLPGSLLDAYAEKYAEGMLRIELPREQYEREYTAAIRLTPDKLRGW